MDVRDDQRICGRAPCEDSSIRGRSVARQTRCETRDHDEILSDESDQVRFVVRAQDQCGNLLPFLSDPIRIRVSGAGRLIGPDTLVFDGGVAGFWIESIGSEGTVDVEVSSPRFEPTHLRLAAVMANALAKSA